MGQKTNPTGIRLGITTESASKWYAGSDYADKLHADLRVREYIARELEGAQVSRVEIERPAKTAKITIHTARAGVIIGQKGQGVENLRQKLSSLMDTPVNLNITEVRKPELSAKLVAEQVAKQLEQRVMFRRAMKRAVTNALRAGAQGVKVCVGGRLGGAEIARSEWYREGRVPLHTFRADIDYNTAEAHTTFGVIGVKVWIFKGEKIGKGVSTENEEAPKEKKKKS